VRALMFFSACHRLLWRREFNAFDVIDHHVLQGIYHRHRNTDDL